MCVLALVAVAAEARLRPVLAELALVHRSLREGLYVLSNFLGRKRRRLERPRLGDRALQKLLLSLHRAAVSVIALRSSLDWGQHRRGHSLRLLLHHRHEALGLRDFHSLEWVHLRRGESLLKAVVHDGLGESDRRLVGRIDKGRAAGKA